MKYSSTRAGAFPRSWQACAEYDVRLSDNLFVNTRVSMGTSFPLQPHVAGVCFTFRHLADAQELALCQA